MSVSDVTSMRVGGTLKRFTDLNESPQTIKASEGNLFGWNIINPNTVDVYMKFYDLLAEDVTVGSSPIVKTIMIPAQGTVGVTAKMHPQLHATTALSVAVTTGLADSDTTAPTTDLVGDFKYA